MTSKNEVTRFAVASLNSMERATDLSHKLRILILAEAWLDLAEQTTQMMEHKSDEAHILMERPISGNGRRMSVQRH